MRQKKHLHKASTIQLQLTQIITVNPGAPAQVLHQDQLTWDFFDFPDDYKPFSDDNLDMLP